jgi:hypothetical protein
LKFLTALTASSSMPMSTVNFVRDAAIELIIDILGHLKDRVVSVLGGISNQMLSEPADKQFVDDFCRWMGPLQGY